MAALDYDTSSLCVFSPSKFSPTNGICCDELAINIQARIVVSNIIL